MSAFTIISTVPDFTGAEFLMPAENEDEFREWLEASRVDTLVTSARGRLAVKVRGAFAAACRPGSRVRYTVEAYERRDGRRIRGLKVDPLE